MSGGAFDYLYKEDIQYLIERTDDINQMIIECQKLNAGHALFKTLAIKTEIEIFLETMNQVLPEIRPIWKAIELYHSGDITIEKLDSMIKEHEKKFDGEMIHTRINEIRRNWLESRISD